MSEGKTVGTEGESADKKVVFDSKDIGKKEKTEYFVKVEGAEARKKEAIRRIKAQKADIIKEEKAKVAAEKKEQKRQRREANRAKRRIKRQAFIKKYKILLIILGLLFAGAIVAVAAYFIINPPLTATEKENLAAYEEWREINRENYNKFDDANSDNPTPYEDALAWYVEQAENADGDNAKFSYYSLAVSYALHNHNVEDAKKYNEILENLASNSEQRHTVYVAYASIYHMDNDEAKAREYAEKAASLDIDPGRIYGE